MKMERLVVVDWLGECIRRLSAPPGSDPESSERQGATLSRVEDLGLSWVKTVVVYVCLSVACVCDCRRTCCLC